VALGFVVSAQPNGAAHHAADQLGGKVAPAAHGEQGLLGAFASKDGGGGEFLHHQRQGVFDDGAGHVEVDFFDDVGLPRGC